MKQLPLSGITPFAPSPVDAPDAVVTACQSEAQAVRLCIAFAREERGMSLSSVAKACGWRCGKSFLSELCQESSGKLMPEKRVRLFTLATGNRLLEQYRERQETLRQLRGNATELDRHKVALAAMRIAA